MSKVDFLVPPTGFQPDDMLGTSHRAETLGALAYHGLLDPAQWLEPLVFKGAFQNKITTFFHRIAPHPEVHGHGKPSAEDIQRARAGETWEAGPGSLERLMLWTLSQQTPTPSMGRALAELAMEHRWRFALEHLANTPGLLASKAFGFEALFEKALTQQHWVGAVHILAAAYVDSPETPTGSVAELAEQWKTKTLTHTAFIPNTLLWLLQKLGSSNESRTRNREAWEAGNAPETWAQDKVGAHLAGTLSFLAHRGMLDLRLETLDPVGGLDGIIVPLRELRLEQSLAATANRPRPRM